MLSAAGLTLCFLRQRTACCCPPCSRPCPSWTCTGRRAWSSTSRCLTSCGTSCWSACQPSPPRAGRRKGGRPVGGSLGAHFAALTVPLAPRPCPKEGPVFLVVCRWRLVPLAVCLGTGRQLLLTWSCAAAQSHAFFQVQETGRLAGEELFSGEDAVAAAGGDVRHETLAQGDGRGPCAQGARVQPCWAGAECAPGQGPAVAGPRGGPFLGWPLWRGLRPRPVEGRPGVLAPLTGGLWLP